jgi:hypothetical protein
MFPDLNQVRDKAATRLGELSETAAFRLAVASLLLMLHLVAFMRAGHSRLGVEFNSTPDEAPYFSDPDAPATQGYPRQPHRWSRLVVSRLDAQHYIGTAERGLSACPTRPSAPDSAYLECGLGWLPAWGTIGGVVADATHMASDKALMFLSIIAAVALNLLWTSPLLVKRLGRRVAWATLIGFNVYPAAFYLVTPYADAATLALAIAGFVALASERWIIAALFVGASTAFAMPALAFSIALGCALLVAAYHRHDQKVDQWWRPLLGLPLVAWGQLATMLVLQIVLGDWSAFLRARDAFGATHEWGRLFDVSYYVKGLAGQNMDVVFLLAFVTIIALTAREVLAKFTRVENVFLVVATGITIILSIVSVPQYWGITHYLMLCPMAFFGIGLMARKYTVLFVLWCVLCLAFYWHVELCGYITQGNSTVCPCLGRIELGMPFGS